MPIEFDPPKDAINRAKHQLSLADVRPFDKPPIVLIDNRFDYGETRYQAFGRLDGQGYCLVFTFTPDGIRAISFRRAHEKEMRRYE